MRICSAAQNLHPARAGNQGGMSHPSGEEAMHNLAEAKKRCTPRLSFSEPHRFRVKLIPFRIFRRNPTAISDSFDETPPLQDRIKPSAPQTVVVDPHPHPPPRANYASPATPSSSYRIVCTCPSRIREATKKPFLLQFSLISQQPATKLLDPGRNSFLYTTLLRGVFLSEDDQWVFTSLQSSI